MPNIINEVVVNGNTYGLPGSGTLSNLATIESNARAASKAYAVGDHLVLNDVYYVVTAAIAQNDALVIGTNIAVAKAGDEISQLNNDLTNKVGGDITSYTSIENVAYDGTNKKLMLKVAGADTPIPFSSGGAKLVGTYSENQTIDVSSYNATSANQFIIVPTEGTCYSGWVNPPANLLFRAIGTFQAGSLSLSGNTLTVTGPRVKSTEQGNNGSGYSYGDAAITYKLYYVG